jgi:uncharacterized damage-inducible protein DinB
MKDQFQKYLAYNVWANTEYINWLNTLPQEALYEKVPSSFPSIIETMMHIWDAQHIWLHRLQGETKLDFPSKTFTGDWAEVCAHVIQTSVQMEALLADHPAEWLDEMFHYTLLNGKAAHTKVADMLLHCTQHSTFHRGQIVTISHVLHMTEVIPPTDYIHYIRKMAEVNS